MAKTISEINEKIKKGQAVVVNAEEIIDIVDEKGTKKASEEVDVVTTATFGPMCSSGAYFNIGHSKPKIKLGGGQVYLNKIPVYAGFAAVDFFQRSAMLCDFGYHCPIFEWIFRGVSHRYPVAPIEQADVPESLIVCMVRGLSVFAEKVFPVHTAERTEGFCRTKES